jgi:uncharacterized membrane protein
MTAPSKVASETDLNRWLGLQKRRWLPLFILVSALLVMGIYAVTDNSRLAHDHVLDGADWVGYAVCHRLTDRSLAINGRQLPLCARCTGMYLGFMLTFLLFGLSGRLRWSELPPLPILLIFIGFIGLMGIDGLNSYSHFFPNAPHLYQPRHWLRLVTGVGTGLAMGSLISPALAQTVWRYHEQRPVIGSLAELSGLLLAAGAAILLVLSNQPALLYVLALASAAGVLLIVTAINTIFLLILLRRDGQAKRWPEAAAPVLVGLLLAVSQIGAISLLRFNLTGTMTGFPGL